THARPYVIRPLVAADLPPFVEAVGREQAAAAPHGHAERRLLVDRLAARIDQEREPGGILHPGRDDAPAHAQELALASLEPHDRHRLGRRHIVARREVRLLLIAEQGTNGLRRRNDCVAATHSEFFPLSARFKPYLTIAEKTATTMP